ncbi:family 43 glycosylhydrolase [Flavobacterium sp. LT1R49]|uniref:family 43 glycosylhydrolase n=1 Tax=Flavobacterium arabinosi TaxID=3398737 RepID=UPI003A85073B
MQLKAQSSRLTPLKSPIIFKGSDTIAYRDPAVLYHKNKFYLFFTLVKTEEGKIYSYTATSHSRDLKNWSPIKIITPKDQSLDFCSPGNIVRFNDEWVLCLQTYPRPDYTVDQKTRYGTKDSRLYIMRSKDLKNWSSPEIIKVKGPEVSTADMGRMIDPYLLEDKDEKGKWWCFYKQNGVSMSYSYDLKNWTFFGHTASGENVCVLNENNEYILIHSPENGIAIKHSSNLKDWKDFGKVITLGQNEWDWAKGRITGGTVINLKKNSEFGKYILFFHGSGPKTEEEGDFDKNASIGIAWSDDLLHWDWPVKKK